MQGLEHAHVRTQQHFNGFHLLYSHPFAVASKFSVSKGLESFNVIVSANMGKLVRFPFETSSIGLTYVGGCDRH